MRKILTKHKDKIIVGIIGIVALSALVYLGLNYKGNMPKHSPPSIIEYFESEGFTVIEGSVSTGFLDFDTVYYDEVTDFITVAQSKGITTFYYSDGGIFKPTLSFLFNNIKHYTRAEFVIDGVKYY